MPTLRRILVKRDAGNTGAGAGLNELPGQQAVLFPGAARASQPVHHPLEPTTAAADSLQPRASHGERAGDGARGVGIAHSVGGAPPGPSSTKNTGMWLQWEHQLFLKGLQIHGEDWVKVSSVIGSRTKAQVSRHARTYFQNNPKASPNSRENTSSKAPLGPPTWRRFPCKARSVREGHTADTAYLTIPPCAQHGLVLACSHPECRESGKRFCFCAVCDLPISKRNFPKRHSHGLVSAAARSPGTDDDHDDSLMERAATAMASSPSADSGASEIPGESEVLRYGGAHESMVQAEGLPQQQLTGTLGSRQSSSQNQYYESQAAVDSTVTMVDDGQAWQQQRHSNENGNERYFYPSLATHARR